MLDTSKWPQRDLEVLKGVRLDPKNVRLELADAEVEADIVEDLFANEDALGLVEAICQVGYLTHETPVVVKRDGEFVMVEGNRRLAALKAIQNPMLVPEYQARVSALTAVLADRSALAQIRVMVAPDQDAADQLVASNCQELWMTGFEDGQAATFSSGVCGCSSGARIPSLKVAPARTSVTSSWPLKRRQRSWAASSSL